MDIPQLCIVHQLQNVSPAVEESVIQFRRYDVGAYEEIGSTEINARTNDFPRHVDVVIDEAFANIHSAEQSNTPADITTDLEAARIIARTKFRKPDLALLNVVIDDRKVMRIGVGL